MEASSLAQFGNVPIGALNASCRRKLSDCLNSEMPLASDEGYPMSWEGLAELIGLKFNRIKLLKEKMNPTGALLDIWEESPLATVGKLVEYLQRMQRYDVLEDIGPFVERDARKYLWQQEEERLRLEARNPVQDPKVTSGDPMESWMTVEDVLESSMEITDDQQPMSYDAYVSYAETDIDFVLKLYEELQVKSGLRLFIKDREMLAGLMESEAQIKMMHERCERIILVLSPEFLNDPKCEFQMVIAQAIQVERNMYSRKVIPVIYKPCELPVRLRYIANLDYTKQDKFGSFWIRLYTSITKANQKGNAFSDTMSTTFGSCLSLPSTSSGRGRSSSIQSSSSTSMLSELEQSGASPTAAAAATALQVLPNHDRLSPSTVVQSQDSGIGISLKSTSTTNSLQAAAAAGSSASTGPTVEPTQETDSRGRKVKRKKTPTFTKFLSKFNTGHSSN